MFRFYCAEEVSLSVDVCTTTCALENFWPADLHLNSNILCAEFLIFQAFLPEKNTFEVNYYFCCATFLQNSCPPSGLIIKTEWRNRNKNVIPDQKKADWNRIQNKYINHNTINLLWFYWNFFDPLAFVIKQELYIFKP